MKKNAVTLVGNVSGISGVGEIYVTDALIDIA